MGPDTWGSINGAGYGAGYKWGRITGLSVKGKDKVDGIGLLAGLMKVYQRFHKNVQQFRGGLVFKAHRFCVSLNPRLESNKEEDTRGCK